MKFKDPFHWFQLLVLFSASQKKILTISMSFIGYYIAYETVFAVCFLICLAVFINWTFFHHHNRNNDFFQKLDSKFIVSQYLSIIFFATVPLILVTQLTTVLIIHALDSKLNTLFVNHIDDELGYSTETGVNISVVAAPGCYLLGRFFSYIIIYRRLKQMLNNSIFAYPQSVYNKINIFLGIYLIDVLAILIILSIHSDELALFQMFILGIWTILDFTYFIWVTYMYLSKLKQIRNTYKEFLVKVHAQTEMIKTGSGSGSGSASGSPTFCDTAISIDSEDDMNNNKFNTGIDIKGGKNGTNGDNYARQIKRTPRKIMDGDGDGDNKPVTDLNISGKMNRGNSSSNYNGAHAGAIRVSGSSNNNSRRGSPRANNINSKLQVSNVFDEKRKAFEVLSKSVVIYTRLSVIIFISSICSFVGIGLIYATHDVPSVEFLVGTIDCVVNVLCLVLYFKKMRQMYYRIACCCCVNHVWGRCVCCP